jgi:hypothetical protein
MVGISFAFLGALIYSRKSVRFETRQAKPLAPNAKTILHPSTKVVSINTETLNASIAEQN